MPTLNQGSDQVAPEIKYVPRGVGGNKDFHIF